MQKVTVPYGEGSLSFPVDDGIEITRLELNDCPPLADFSAELECLPTPRAARRCAKS